VIKRIESNVKTGCQVDIGPKTLIVGPNFSGKSTIVNAIELATTGRASDVAGRATLALDTELVTLMPPGAESVFARAFHATGQVAWALEKGHKATRGATPSPAPEYVFPLREVRDNLIASPAKARTWLLGFVAAEVEWATVLARIAPALHERVTRLTGGVIAGLPIALDTARRGTREATARAATLREVVPVPIVHAPPPPTDLSAFDAEVRKATAERAVAQTALDVLPPADTATADIGAKMIAILRGQIAAKSPTCGICGAGGDVARFAARLTAIEAKIRGVSEAAANRNAAAQRVNAAISRLTSAQAAWQTVQQTATAVAVAVTGAQAEAAQNREAEAIEADRAANEWRELAEAIARVMTAIVGEGRSDFESRVQRFMPVGMTFGLDLLDGDREVCRFGLRSGDSLRSALSGAEWAIVTAAIAMAVTPEGANAIIIPEERAFDPESLADALMAFDVGPAQVIVTSPIMPASVPAGWTVIRCGGEIAASAALPAATAGTGTPPPAPPVPVKRGRGRPRKNPLPEAAPTEAAAPSNGAVTSDLPWT